MALSGHPACGVPVSTTSVQAQSLAWHEHLGWSRCGLLPGVGDPKHHFSESVASGLRFARSFAPAWFPFRYWDRHVHLFL